VPGAVYGAHEWWHPYVGEWKNGGARDLILGVYDFDTSETTTTRFFTGINAGPPSYIGWAAANFGSPGLPEAQPAADPDGDGHQNLVEFAVNTSPVIVSELPVTHSRTPDGLLQIALVVRNNDPALAALSARGEGSTNLNAFSGNFPPAITDPVPGDGYALWTFTDQPPPGANPRRFLQVVFQVN
jgi:hypothetical protein